MDKTPNKKSTFTNKAKDKNQTAPNELVLLIREVEEKIDKINCLFNLETDDDLIESYIFEIKALMARYRYLHKLAKQNGTINPIGKYNLKKSG